MSAPLLRASREDRATIEPRETESNANTLLNRSSHLIFIKAVKLRIMLNAVP